MWLAIAQEDAEQARDVVLEMRGEMEVNAVAMKSEVKRVAAQCQEAVQEEAAARAANIKDYEQSAFGEFLGLLACSFCTQGCSSLRATL